MTSNSRAIRRLSFKSFFNRRCLLRCCRCCLKPWPNDRNSSTQQITTLLVQYLQAPAKRSQHFDATYRNIVGRSMLHAKGHPVATCCGMLRVENRTSAHALLQHCCKSLAKRLQHHASSTNAVPKIWPFSNLSQQHPTCRNLSQHVAAWWPNARNLLRPTMLRYIVVIGQSGVQFSL